MRPPGMGHPEIALEVDPSCRRICWYSLLGGQEGTLEGPIFCSLDSYILPSVTSRFSMAWPQIQVTSLSGPCDSPLSAASHLPGQQQSFYCLLASCLKPLHLWNSNPSRKFLWVCELLCILSSPTPGSSEVPSSCPSCLPSPVGWDVRFQSALALWCSWGLLVSPLIWKFCPVTCFSYLFKGLIFFLKYYWLVYFLLSYLFFLPLLNINDSVSTYFPPNTV